MTALSLHIVRYQKLPIIDFEMMVTCPLKMKKNMLVVHRTLYVGHRSTIALSYKKVIS